MLPLPSLLCLLSICLAGGLCASAFADPLASHPTGPADPWAADEPFAFASSVLARYTVFHLLNPTFSRSHRPVGGPLEIEDPLDSNTATAAEQTSTPFDATLLSSALSLGAVSAPKNAEITTFSAHGADYSWNGTSGSWDTATLWTPSTGYPNAAGAIARYNGSAASTTTQSLTGGVTVGTITRGGSANAAWTILPTNGITLSEDGSGLGFATISNTNTSTLASGRLLIGSSAAPGTLTLGDDLLVSNTSGNTSATSSISILAAINGTGSVTFSNVKNDPESGSILVGGNNSYTGATTIRSGSVTFNSSTAFGLAANVVNLGSAGGGSATLASTSAVTLANNIVVASGSGGTLTLGSTSTSTSSNNRYTGTVTLNGDVTLTSSAPASNPLTFTNKITGTGNVVKTGAGVVSFTGANDYTGGTTINAGTLSAGVGALVSTSSVTVNSGGTLLLSGNGRHMGNATEVRLAGGTFNTGGFSEPTGGQNIGALTLTLTSTIDFGSSNTSILQFGGVGSQTEGQVLQIINWNGVAGVGGSGDRLLFDGLAADFTSRYSQNEVSFNNTSGYSIVQYDVLSGNPYYEITQLTPVPEPSTWAAGALALASLAFARRRRCFALAKRAA